MTWKPSLPVTSIASADYERTVGSKRVRPLRPDEFKAADAWIEEHAPEGEWGIPIIWKDRQPPASEIRLEPRKEGDTKRWRHATAWSKRPRISNRDRVEVLKPLWSDGLMICPGLEGLGLVKGDSSSHDLLLTAPRRSLSGWRSDMERRIAVLRLQELDDRAAPKPVASKRRNHRDELETFIHSELERWIVKRNGLPQALRGGCRAPTTEALAEKYGTTNRRLVGEVRKKVEIDMVANGTVLAAVRDEGERTRELIERLLRKEQQAEESSAPALKLLVGGRS